MKKRQEPDPYPYRLVTPELRLIMIQEQVLPQLRFRFQQQPDFQSAAMLVAQFWNDEALDAVNACLYFSVLETPNLEACFDAYDLDEPDQINWPRPPDEELEGADAHAFVYLTIPNNYMAIPAFAAFCREGANQCMSYREAYSLYAVFRRHPKGIQMERDNQMLRPWLDGIAPEWEAGRVVYAKPKPGKKPKAEPKVMIFDDKNLPIFSGHV